MRRHGLAAALCVVMLLSVFVSSAYLAHEAAHPHDCAGEKCPVCQFIAQINQLRRDFSIALSALLMICLALAVRRDLCHCATADVPAGCTLVGRKIRLND